MKLLIKSKVNGLEQTVTPQQLEVLKSHGWKGSIVKTIEPVKAAKTPEEVSKK